MEYNKGFMVILLLAVLGIGFIALLTFIVVDWNTGEHGHMTITAVDRNLFWTYTVYGRNSESLSGVEVNEFTYCIDADNKELADFAKSVNGKKNTKLIYSEKRIGLFWFDKCGEAPIKEIVLGE